MYYINSDELEKYLSCLCTSGENIQSNRCIADGIDVVPGLIEGGWTIWDGSRDLIKFIYRKSIYLKFKNKNILELGCGCGLPGILALKHGAKLVRFQVSLLDLFEHI